MTTAEEGNKVKILLEGKLEDGSVFDRTDRSTPIEFTVGEGRMLPKIENAVKGMKAGEKKSIRLEPEEAFGERREDLIKDVPRDAIALDRDPKVGAILLLKTADGIAFSVTVVKVGKETLRLDLNHPLAGKNVVITIEVIAVE